MAKVVAFPSIAPRTAPDEKTVLRADGETTGDILVFTGVWHERVNNPKPVSNPPAPAESKSR